VDVKSPLRHDASELVIDVHGVTEKIRRRTVVNDIRDASAPPAEIYGFSDRTAVARRLFCGCICGLLKPDAGSGRARFRFSRAKFKIIKQVG